MGAVQVRQPAITADSGEQCFVPVLLDYHMNTGWDWMEEAEAAGWYAVGTWGVDGYDLGQWPYVIVVARRLRDDTGPLYGLGVYCEGDVRTQWFRTRAGLWEAITAEAFFYWKLRESDGPKIGWAETAAELPIGLRRPSGWRPGLTTDEEKTLEGEEDEQQL